MEDLAKMKKDLDKDVQKAEEKLGKEASVSTSGGLPVPNTATSPVPTPVPAMPEPSVNDVPAQPAAQNADQALFSDAMRTKAVLDQERKVTMHIPLNPGEKPGAEDVAVINGYRYTVKKGQMIELPESIAKLFMDHYNIQNFDSPYALSRRADRDDDTQKALSA